MLRVVGIIDPKLIAFFRFSDVSLGKIVLHRVVRHRAISVVPFELGVVAVEISGAYFDCLFAEGVALTFGPPCILMFIETGLGRSVAVSEP